MKHSSEHTKTTPEPRDGQNGPSRPTEPYVIPSDEPDRPARKRRLRSTAGRRRRFLIGRPSTTITMHTRAWSSSQTAVAGGDGDKGRSQNFKVEAGGKPRQWHCCLLREATRLALGARPPAIKTLAGRASHLLVPLLPRPRPHAGARPTAPPRSAHHRGAVASPPAAGGVSG